MEMIVLTPRVPKNHRMEYRSSGCVCVCMLSVRFLCVNSLNQNQASAGREPHSFVETGDSRSSMSRDISSVYQWFSHIPCIYVLYVLLFDSDFRNMHIVHLSGAHRVYDVCCLAKTFVPTGIYLVLCCWMCVCVRFTK